MNTPTTTSPTADAPKPPAQAKPKAAPRWNKAQQDESRFLASTYAHVFRVSQLMTGLTEELLRRARLHDQSKFSPEERPFYQQANFEVLKGIPYGSDEYRQQWDLIKTQLKPGSDHHTTTNSHHPEAHAEGILGMHLVDLLEMVCDWMAAGERSEQVDHRAGFAVNKERYNIADPLFQVLLNTLDLFEQLEPQNKGMDASLQSHEAPFKDQAPAGQVPVAAPAVEPTPTAEETPANTVDITGKQLTPPQTEQTEQAEQTVQTEPTTQTVQTVQAEQHPTNGAGNLLATEEASSPVGVQVQVLPKVKFSV